VPNVANVKLNPQMKTSTITRTTRSSLKDVCARLPAIAASHKFGVLGVHDLKEKMNSKGVPFDRDCSVFEVCNPQQAQRILNGDIHVSAALPCRISVFSERGETVLATIEPTALLALFGQPQGGGAEIANEVRQELIAIMEEACRD
jgi:uncharacterized protein (DUF302 family)